MFSAPASRAYLLLGLLWAAGLRCGRPPQPGAFALPAAAGGAGPRWTASSAFYFSFITLCTVGYGDVAPVSKVARMLAVTEAITGLFYVAVMISRLVAVYSSTQPAADEQPPSRPGEP